MTPTPLRPQDDPRAALRWVALLTLLLALILIPFIVLQEQAEVISAAMLSRERFGTATIALWIVVLLASDVLLPVPSSVVATGAGFLLGWPLGAAASCTGMTLGCVLGYALVRRFGEVPAARMITEGQRSWLSGVAAKRGDWMLALARPIPVLAEASVFMAAIARMRYGRFLGITTAANACISLVYAVAGSHAATRGSFFVALAAAVLLPAIAMLLRKVGERFG